MPVELAGHSFWKSTHSQGMLRSQERFQQPFGGSAAYNIIYQWLPAGDQAFEPTMAVDSNIASFTDPTTGEVQTDTAAGNVYVAWATGTVAPASPAPPSPFFNPNTIVMVTSTDGGQDFNAPELLNTIGLRANDRAGCGSGDHNQSRAIA